MRYDDWLKHGDGTASLTMQQVFNHQSFNSLMKDVENLRKIIKESDYCDYYKEPTSEHRCNLCSVSIRENCSHLIRQEEQP
jgi:hypothetical protein